VDIKRGVVKPSYKELIDITTMESKESIIQATGRDFKDDSEGSMENC